MNYNAEWYNNRGLAYYYKGRYNKAIEDYTRAIALDPNCDSAHHNLKVAYQYKQNITKQ